MMPAVAVLAKPSGLPSAIASAPTGGSVVSNRAAGRLVRDTRTTARSVTGSVASTLPATRCPSAKPTVTFVASPTTCWLVTITPSSL
jgi:hypothetical protein